MIIWGSKGKEKLLSEGLFFCPKCRTDRSYKQKRVSKYFTFYFIPLFETKNLGEFVECQVCKSGYDPKILEPNSQGMLKVVASTRYSLLHGTSLTEVKSQLVGAGVTEGIADQIIKVAQS
jgi:hypothetical protein